MSKLSGRSLLEGTPTFRLMLCEIRHIKPCLRAGGTRRGGRLGNPGHCSGLGLECGKSLSLKGIIGPNDGPKSCAIQSCDIGLLNCYSTREA